jgi:hypothetical protein
MNNLADLIRKTLDELMDMYPPVPKEPGKRLEAKVSPSLPVPSVSKSAPCGQKAVSLTNLAQIRRKFELEEAQLRRMHWTDERLALIPEESLATLAYSLSNSLKMEFGNDKGNFLAYWRRLRAV